MQVYAGTRLTGSPSRPWGRRVAPQSPGCREELQGLFDRPHIVYAQDVDPLGGQRQGHANRRGLPVGLLAQVAPQLFPIS